MTFGNSPSSRLLLVAITLLGGAGRAAAGSDWTVESLMGLLKTHQELSVEFEETTYSSLLTEPVRARGRLRFVPPERLEKIITAPFTERYVVDGDRVSFESERRKVNRTVSLEEYPVLRSFVEAFRSSLTGDVVQLRRVYEVTLEGSRSKWTLLLRPRDLEGKSLVDYILLTGSQGKVGTIAIRSPDGDRSVMTLLRGAAR
jgi:outer membrane lipoprotein-sorting protein